MKCLKPFVWFIVYIGSFFVGDIRWLEWAPWAAAACLWAVAFCHFILACVPDKIEPKQKAMQGYRDGKHIPGAVDLFLYCILFSVLFDAGWYLTFGATMFGGVFDFVLRQQAKEKKEEE